MLIVSILGLFLELVVIRWLATEIRIFAYFKNLPLMSAFLGFGLGLIWTPWKRDLFNLSMLAFLYFSGLLIFSLLFGLTFLVIGDPLQLLLFGFTPDSSFKEALLSTPKTLAIMIAVFALSTCVFVGFGQRIGRLFSQLAPLQAYSINVIGSLLGTVLFSVLSFFYCSPGIWLIVAGLLFMTLKKRLIPLLIIALGFCYLFWLGDFIALKCYGSDYIKSIWSPYYRIDIAHYRPLDGPMKGKHIGEEIYVNYDGFQSILDLSNKGIAEWPQEFHNIVLWNHSVPFRLFPNSNSNVLILGSGAGADVAAALRAGVGHIDAVEIDPAIASLGRDFHPEHPYLSPKVHLHVEDARTFLKNCKDKYDVIELAYLDSHAAFSCLSSLRMDNYVFTQEALQDCARLLKPNGFLALGCVLMTDWLWDRHSRNVFAATGMKPWGYGDKEYSRFATGILIAGPGLVNKERTAAQPNTLISRPVTVDSPVPPTTDDWPFLFLKEPGIPTYYLLPILSIFAISFVPVATQFRRGAKDLTNWRMFFMGAAFMLLEVRAMADLALLFGSTWIINSVIIGGVMLVILIGNFVASRLELESKSVSILSIGLFLGLAVTMLIKASNLASFGMILGGIFGAICYMIPMALASTLFALFLKHSRVSTDALAFNLLGGTLGICLEYASMVVGIRAIGWIVIACYALALMLFFCNTNKQVIERSRA